MSNTGVGIASDVVTTFNEYKLRSTARYLIFKMNDGLTEIVIEHVGTSTDYNEFVAQLPANDCRYAVYNVGYSTDDGERNKIVFFLWAPDSSKVKSKMLYAGTKDTIKKALQGLQVEIQGTDKSEVTWDAVVEKCRASGK
eukprot:TRINITY_DN1897_c0_g1_i2.p1 TRINITY_DN1897_c0_g1~~TRINITY_DN1897_c0_g1_i2.p1  ORF type:complete len:140 (-),score=25.88 TRINITY_DN1897_c0_g1_i2:54-473(-)